MFHIEGLKYYPIRFSIRLLFPRQKEKQGLSKVSFEITERISSPLAPTKDESALLAYILTKTALL